MPNLESRIDITAEIEACERICSFDETRLNSELRKAGVEPDGLIQRLEAGLDLASTATDESSEPEPRSEAVRQAPQPSALAGTASMSHPPKPTVAAATIASGLSGAATFEIAGKMKFFDASKGYGFLAADEEQGDVLVHVSHLQAAGYRTVYEGARIHAVVHRTAKGLQVTQILNIDETSAIHPSQIPPRTREKVRAESAWVRALVKWYNAAQGYGFVLERDGSPDCFVHADVLRRWGMAPLRPGQVVEVRWGMSSRGRMVAEIRHPDGASGLPPVH